MRNYCVSCGDVIPEGRQVCPICMAKAEAGEMKYDADEFLHRGKKTNADLIRSLDDDQLCEFLGWITQDAFCYGAGLRNKMELYPFGSMESTEKWLREEVTDEERALQELCPLHSRVV